VNAAASGRGSSVAHWEVLPTRFCSSIGGSALSFPKPLYLLKLDSARSTLQTARQMTSPARPNRVSPVSPLLRGRLIVVISILPL